MTSDTGGAASDSPGAARSAAAPLGSADETILDDLYGHVLYGEADAAVATLELGLVRPIAPATLLFDAMIPALEEVGRRFESGEWFLPEMLIAARAMRASMTILRPRMSASDAPPRGTIVMGTVAGDIHDIGKDMVDIMLEGAGFTVIDLGINVPAARFVEAIHEHRPAIVGLSAFLTTTMPQVGRTIEAIRVAGLRDVVRVIVGGAPINEEFAAEVGADGTASDASSAARLARSLVASPAGRS
jgi:methanogenic corrinoid protein MtbC1